MTGPKTGGRSLLLPRIAKREWDVVAQLAFQIQNKNVEGAADELLNMIIQHFERAEGEVKWILLSFAARCLEFLVPSPRIARKITLSSLQLSMSLGEKAKIVGGPIPEADKESRWVLGSLLDSSSENWSPISDCIENFVKTCYSQENETRAAVAVEVAFSLGMARQSTLRSLSREKGSRQHWRDISTRLTEGLWDLWKNLPSKYAFPCVLAYWKNLVSLKDVVKWHGLEFIFSSCAFSIFANNYLSPVARSILSEALGAVVYRESGGPTVHPRGVEEMGRILESIDPPWLKREAVGQFRVHDPFDLIAGRKSLDFNLIEAGFSPQSIFGYFSLAAIISEMDRNDEKEKPDPQRIKQCFPQPISTIIVSRSGRDVEADSAIAGCKFSPRQQSIVTGWARREINLLG